MTRRNSVLKGRFRGILIAGLMVPLLAACADPPTQLTAGRAEVREQMTEFEYDTAGLDAARFDEIATAYKRFGGGPMSVSVTYDPSARGAVARAKSDLARIQTALRARGVTAGQGETIPFNPEDGGGNMVSTTLIVYNEIAAHAPPECEGDAFTAPDGEIEDRIRNYAFGCEVEKQIARQVYRPADLRGRPMEPYSDGRKNANIVDSYRTGAPLEALEGENASGD